jgi:hypothetical protein
LSATSILGIIVHQSKKQGSPSQFVWDFKVDSRLLEKKEPLASLFSFSRSIPASR